MGDRFWDRWKGAIALTGFGMGKAIAFLVISGKGRSLSIFTLECEFCKLLPVVIYLDNAPHYRAMISILLALPSTEE